MRLQICTEADYLRAHITIIAEESRPRNGFLRSLKHLVTSILKRWIAAPTRIPG
jgi:hypothetical protein